MFLFSVLKNNLFWFVFTFVGFGCGCYFNWDKIQNIKLKEFTVQHIEFDGYDRVPEVLLLKSSGLRYKSSIWATSPQDVKNKLEKISWIKSVSVQRKLPDTFNVRVTERIPIAILQSKYKLYLLDIDGKKLEHDGIGNFDNLPIVVGEGAEEAAGYLLFILNKFPKIRNQLVVAVFVGKRRWNIRINKGIIVKLPEKNLSHAMSVLDEISDDEGFFNENIEEIDLRMLDRVILRIKDGNS